MKILSHEIETKGAKTVLKTQWQDHMRRPISLVIAKDISDQPPGLHNTIETESMAHMFGMLSGFAEIAWARGWRPRGLVSMVNHVVSNYKEPKREI